MERIQLGHDGITVSRLCLGAMALGTDKDPADAFAILDRFVELGGNFIDTANCYTYWVPGCTGDESERLLGSWLAERGNRDQIVLGTKVGRRPTVAGDLGHDHSEPLTRGRIGAAIDESLERLGCDHVDVYWSHRDDRDTDQAETVSALGEQVAAGKARMVAASNHTAWRVERARRLADDAGTARYQAMQNRYSYLRPRPGAALEAGGHVHADAADLDYVANTDGMAMLTYSALLSGRYARADRPLEDAYRHPGTDARLAVLADVAAELGATRNQVVLAWLARHDRVVPLVGVSSVDQLDEVAAGIALKLDDDQCARLDTAA
jgi:aryl-alcohol dehydrogenase-like predicted oxidoreductase